MVIRFPETATMKARHEAHALIRHLERFVESLEPGIDETLFEPWEEPDERDRTKD